MNEQIIILIFLVLALGATLWLYILKAKKQVEYKGDERWLTIQLKANRSANIANWTLIILLAIATSVPLFIDIQIMFTLDRVILFGELFIGLRNLLELIAIMYFDKSAYLQAFHGFYEFIIFHQKSSIYKKLVSKLVSNNLNLRF